MFSLIIDWISVKFTFINILHDTFSSENIYSIKYFHLIVKFGLINHMRSFIHQYYDIATFFLDTYMPYL
jgi:hypothetical protein